MRVRDVELATLADSVLSRESADLSGVESLVIGRALLAPVERSGT
ncbi:hypothetical protein EV589_0545 [Mycobacterium sp. BK558]|nr:hypothetical protein EV589_0545 [Mycobacterium sp. BK558]